ncbi:MAG: PKD domain-containing protein [Bacteroidota bacterium]
MNLDILLCFSMFGKLKLRLIAMCALLVISNCLIAACPNPDELDFQISATRCVGTTVVFSAFTSGTASDVFEIITEGDTIRSAPFEYTYTTSGTKEVILRRIATDNCSDQIARSLIISAPPIADFSFDSDNSDPPCASELIQFTNTGSSGPGLEYSWDFGDGNTSTEQNPGHMFAVIGSANRSLTVTLTILDTGTGCSASISQTVIVRESPQVRILDEFGGSIDEFNNCGVSTTANPEYTIEFNDDSESGATNYTVDWGDGSPLFNSSSAPSTHTYTTLDVFTIIYTVTGPNGCVETKEIPVLNITNPGVGIVSLGNTNGCSPLVIPFEIRGVDNNHSSTTYTVDFGDGSDVVEFNHPPPSSIDHTYTSTSCGQPGDSFEASIVATNACLTTTSTVDAIVIFTPPQAEFEPAQEVICVGSPLTFHNTTIAGANTSCSSQARYIWDYGDGSDPDTVFTLSNVEHTFSTAGSYNVTLNVRNSCDDSEFTQEILVCDELPVAAWEAEFGGVVQASGPNCDDSALEINLPAGSCPPVTINLTNNSLIPCMDSILWSIDALEGFAFSNGETTSGNLSETVTFSRGGTYVCKLTVMNACGVSESCLKFVINDEPTAAAIIDGSDVYCEIESIDLSATEVAGADSYRWEITGTSGTPDPSVSVDLNIRDIDPFQLPAGSYNVSIFTTNVCGEANATLPITVIPVPSADISPADSQVLCEGEELSLSAPVATGVSYQWLKDGEEIIGENSAELRVSEAGTYSVRVGSGSCETIGNEVEVSIVASPDVDISTDDSLDFCEGETISVTFSATNNAAFSYQWQLNEVDIPAATSSSFTAEEEGRYRVMVADAQCPGISDILEIVRNPLPVLSVTPESSSVCLNDSIMLSASGALTYQWSPANGLSSITGPTVMASPSDTTIYTITGVDNLGCSSDITVQVDTRPVPQVIAAPFDDEICVGEETVIVVSGAETYEWLADMSLDTLRGNTVTASPQVTTTYFAVGFNELGCSDTLSTTVLVDELPAIEAGDDRAVCINDGLINLFENPDLSPPGGMWSGNGINADGIFDPLSAGVGTYTFTYSFEDNTTGCPNEDQFQLTVEPIPATAFDVPAQVCAGFPVAFENNTPISNGQLSYMWDFGDGSESDDSDPVYTFPNTGVFTVSLSAINRSTGCNATVTRMVEVLEAPVAEFARSLDDNIFCGPIMLSFTNNSTGTDLTYRWDFGNGITSEEESPGSITFIPNLFTDTAYVVSLDVISNLTFCPVRTFYDTIRVSPNPTARFQFQRPVCADFPVNFNNSSFGAPEQFIWDFGDGSPAEETTSIRNRSHTYRNETDIDTTFFVTLIAINNCETDTSVLPIVVPPNQVNAFFDTEVLEGCSPFTVRLNSNQISESNNRITWLLGDGTTKTDSLSIQHTYETSGEYFPSLIVENGCNVDTCNFLTNPECGFAITVLENATASFEADSIVCFGDEVTIVNTSSSDINNFWYFGDGNTFPGVNPGSYRYDSVGEYTISLTVEHPNGCVSPLFEKQVTVDDLPVASFTIPDENYCDNDVVLVQNTSNGASNYLWQVSQSSFASTDSNPQIPFPSEGLFDIVLTATDENGCQDRTVESVLVGASPEIDFRVDTASVGCGDLEVFIENRSSFPESEAIRYDWFLGDSLIMSGEDDFSITQTNFLTEEVSGSIRLIVESVNQCESEVSRQFSVPAFEADVFVPENTALAITPGELTNNLFRLNFKNIADYQMRIFNRWGNEVFATDDPMEGWNGKYNGQIAETGSYVVQVSFNDCSGTIGDQVKHLELIVLKKK